MANNKSNNKKTNNKNKNNRADNKAKNIRADKNKAGNNRTDKNKAEKNKANKIKSRNNKAGNNKADKSKDREKFLIRITDMTEDGKGIGRSDGFAVFVAGGIPGDLVKAEIYKKKKRFALAELLEILEPSPSRIESDCFYSANCGGCSLRESEYGAQLEMKRMQISEKLTRIAGIESPKVNDVISDFLPEGASDASANESVEGTFAPCSNENAVAVLPGRYRNKAVFAVSKTSQGAVVGFRERGGSRVVDVRDCLIQKEPVIAVANAMRELIDGGLISVFDAKTGKGLLREFTVKLCEGTGEMMLVLTCVSSELENTEAIVYAVADAINETQPDDDSEFAFFLQSVVVEVKNSKDINEPARDYVVIAGKGTITDEVIFNTNSINSSLTGLNLSDSDSIALKYEISAPAFYQVNTSMMKRLYEMVADYASLEGGETLFDIYCGIGTIGLFFAERAGMVVGIESVKRAVIDANRNAVINGIVNARYYTGKAETVLSRLFDPEDKLYAGYIDESAERVAVIDPPRAGCDESLLRSLAEAGVSRIVYISCEPGTLARDIKILDDLGYKFIEATPVDMFPYTARIETVCLLSKLHEAKHHINVKVDMDELDLTSAEAKATYKEIEEWVQENYGFHVTNLNIAQVKQKHGIIERENYNKPKSEDSRQPGCPEEKVKAIEDALRNFKMI